MGTKNKHVELELRSELDARGFETLLEKLSAVRKPSVTRRLSVMFLGEIDRVSFDIRVRISSGGKTELVVKRGDFHSHNRVEHSQEIEKNQALGLVQILFLFGFRSKMTERENFDFLLPEDIQVTLVRAKHIYYVEFEKKTDALSEEKDRQKVQKEMGKFGLIPITRAQFDDLCGRLSAESDRPLTGSDSDLQYLKATLENY